MLKLSKAAAHNGVMVALFPTPTAAAMLAQPGGEPAEDLHVTLAFLGDGAELAQPDRLKQAVAGFAATVGPLTGEVSGVGQFTAGPDPVTYASVDLPGLPAVRERLVEALCGAGFEPSAEHGFAPHMTLAYDDRDVQAPNLPLVFDQVTVAVAGERTSYPLSGVVKEESMARAEWDVPIWKADAQRIVYGVVLQPGVVDSQGDLVSPQEIEQAAHRYLVESRKNDLQHDEQANPAIDVVESYIAPSDLVVAGRPVLKGSWVMGVYVGDDAVWSAVQKGDITGFSIGGTAVRSEA